MWPVYMQKIFDSVKLKLLTASVLTTIAIAMYLKICNTNDK